MLVTELGLLAVGDAMAAKKKLAESIHCSVQDLVRLFAPQAAESLEANYCLRVKEGDATPKIWTFSVFRGKCGLLPGDDLESDVTLTFDAPTLEELISGVNDVAGLYAQRRLGIKGNVDLALRFPKLFSTN